MQHSHRSGQVEKESAPCFARKYHYAKGSLRNRKKNSVTLQHAVLAEFYKPVLLCTASKDSFLLKQILDGGLFV